MKCPRRFHPNGDGDCLEDECAWWVDIEWAEDKLKLQGCAVRILAVKDPNGRYQ